MIVSLREYAAQYGKSGDMMRRFAERGTLKTARKIGRNWVVDSDEPYPVRMRKEKTSRPRFSVVSLFSGCGGMDLGFLGGFDFLGTHYGKTGFDIVWANELDHNACKTYRRNFGDDYLVEGDINEQMDSLPETADIVIGGFPCQDISINGKMLGIKGKRSSLYTAIVETVQRIQPKMFIAENVGGLLMKKNEYSLNKILDDFNSLGYNISYQLYNAADYGVPQTRERIFIVGTRSDVAAFCPPKPLNSEPITARMALNDLENCEWNPDIAQIWSKAKVSGEQGNRKLVADRPGYTIRSECHGNIQFHYSLPRRISMREAARLQSFPDDFVFPCGLRATERQIGNAVPPVLAWMMAMAASKALLEVHDEKKRVREAVG